MHPATLFSQEVLSDDMFGAFFANERAMLPIVAAMTTVPSFNYMRKHGHHADLLFKRCIRIVGDVCCRNGACGISADLDNAAL